MIINIAKLEHPERHGDWHDPLIRWAVLGPGAEIQKFSTRKEASRYRNLRRNSRDQNEAIFAYADISLTSA